MNASVANARLAKLRGYRVPPAVDRSIAVEVGRIARQLRQTDRVLNKVEEVWAAAAPDTLRDLARPVSFKAGVLELACAAAAVRFEIDRWLQGGGRGVLEKTLGSTIFRVSFTSGGRSRVPRNSGRGGRERSS